MTPPLGTACSRLTLELGALSLSICSAMVFCVVFGCNGGTLPVGGSCPLSLRFTFDAKGAVDVDGDLFAGRFAMATGKGDTDISHGFPSRVESGKAPTIYIEFCRDEGYLICVVPPAAKHGVVCCECSFSHDGTEFGRFTAREPTVVAVRGSEERPELCPPRSGTGDNWLTILREARALPTDVQTNGQKARLAP